MDPFPQGGFYWIKGNGCQVTSAIRERKWCAVNHYTCLHIICFCSFWISDVAKHYWWAFWIISPLKATYKAPLTDFGTQFFFYIFVHFFDRMYLSALLNEHSFPPGYFPSVLISQVQVFFFGLYFLRRFSQQGQGRGEQERWCSSTLKR